MIIENFIIVEVFAIIFFLIAFFRKNLLSWAVSAVLFGANIFSAYAIENNVYYMMLNGTVTYTTYIHSYPAMAYVNMLFFAVCVIFAIGDMLTEGQYETVQR
jgi:hypothetical protein